MKKKILCIITTYETPHHINKQFCERIQYWGQCWYLLMKSRLSLECVQYEYIALLFPWDKRVRERKRERGRIKELDRKIGGGGPLEAPGPAFTLLPGTLRTPETLFTQQPWRGLGLRSYLLRAWPAIRCWGDLASSKSKYHRSKPTMEEEWSAQPKSWSSANVYSLVWRAFGWTPFWRAHIKLTQALPLLASYHR